MVLLRHASNLWVVPALALEYEAISFFHWQPFEPIPVVVAKVTLAVMALTVLFRLWSVLRVPVQPQSVLSRLFEWFPLSSRA